MMMALVVAALLQTPGRPAATAPSVNTIARGQFTRIDSPQQVVARTAEQWTALWRAHAPDREPPAVDFSKDMVVAVFLGSRPTAGFRVEIVGIREEKGKTIVQYREARPPSGAITAQVITAPFHIVTVAATTGEIAFEKSD
jgi:hypothetical protein